MKEDSLISSTASLASISKAASRGRSGASGSGRYSSPLDFSHLVHQATASAPHHHLAVHISVRVGVEAGLLPPTGARVFGGRSHVPIQSL